MTKSSWTHSLDLLGHGEMIRGAVSAGRIPDMDKLGGLGSARYPEEKVQIVWRALSILTKNPSELASVLQPLNYGFSHTTSVGLNSAVLRSLFEFQQLKYYMRDEMDGVRVVEIGAGIGTFPATFVKLAAPNAYFIYDLPDMLSMQKLYLSHVLGAQVGRVRFMNALNASSFSIKKPFDLCFSTYAFAELSQDVQDIYLDNVIKHCERGYFIYDHLPSLSGLRSYPAIRFFDLLASYGKEILCYRPDPHVRLGIDGTLASSLITWGLACG